jgi:hypothetical protein
LKKIFLSKKKENIISLVLHKLDNFMLSESINNFLKNGKNFKIELNCALPEKYSVLNRKNLFISIQAFAEKLY